MYSMNYSTNKLVYHSIDGMYMHWLTSTKGTKLSLKGDVYNILLFATKIKSVVTAHNGTIALEAM